MSMRLVACLVGLGLSAFVSADERSAFDFFESRIRPVLVEHCYECHSGRAKKIEGKLRLDSRAAMRRGGASGPVVVPKRVDKSLIISALRYDDLEMPPDKKLPARVVADFVRWIELGAPDPRDKPVVGRVADAARRHWSFQPVKRPQLPLVKHTDRVLSPIDRFVLARLERGGLPMSPTADRRTLIRRASFDLLGMPPAPEQVDVFLADDQPDAFARLVDRLLDSPHYGERWGRYWLDVARYADNKGYVFFEEKKFPWAWTYRDYVIRAFNEDLPFDQFVLQQLAADQLDLGDDRRPLTAMGYLTLGARFMNNTHDVFDDRIDVVMRGMMGLTVTCARCHDHKFDPISQEDYYALYGVMRSSSEPILPPEFLPAAKSDTYQKFTVGMQERLRKLDEFIAAQRKLIVTGARRRAAEYMLTVHKKRNHPETENFMLLTDKGALNPAMIHRWEVYLKRVRRVDDPVWTVWHEFSELPDKDFPAAAISLHRQLFERGRSTSINPLVRKAFAGQPPKSMKQVARRYGELFVKIDDQWQQQEKEASNNQDKPQRIADDAAESLRQVLYGAGSPPMIPRELSWGFLSLLPDRPTQGEYKKLLKDVETWAMSQPGAPPRAMVLVDAESPYQPVVSCVEIRIESVNRFRAASPHSYQPKTQSRFHKAAGAWS
ncbi:MAG: DUF1549 domain-containing protein [Planctomycetes bacterium]|nr:DUF1549 domain-containing protein [Planctomycetota bacterium]